MTAWDEQEECKRRATRARAEGLGADRPGDPRVRAGATRDARGLSRADFPGQDPELAVNLLWRPDAPVAREAVNAPSPEVAELLEGRYEVAVAGRMLE